MWLKSFNISKFNYSCKRCVRHILRKHRFGEILQFNTTQKSGCLISTRQPLFIRTPIGEARLFKQISEPFFNNETAS